MGDDLIARLQENLQLLRDVEAGCITVVFWYAARCETLRSHLQALPLATWWFVCQAKSQSSLDAARAKEPLKMTHGEVFDAVYDQVSFRPISAACSVSCTELSVEMQHC